MLDDSFKQRIRLGRLYDVYGPLLTGQTAKLHGTIIFVMTCHWLKLPQSLMYRGRPYMI
mgnify:CR=1 FL=1